jgi:deoxycytidine triphosphate deaminase
MILNDSEIARRIAGEALIQCHDADQVRNCGYSLRAGRVFHSGDGKELLLNHPHEGKQGITWQLGPTETLVVMTRERVKMPADLCAFYTPLHRMATQGIMLLNPAVVEPGYEGPLSCFLVNFSSQAVQIHQDQPISKIVFHKLENPPANAKPMQFSNTGYAADLSRLAARYHQSFMDVSGIEKRAADSAQKSVRNFALGGGIVVAFLVLFSTLEPLFSKYLWEKTGVTSSTQRTADIKLGAELDNARERLAAAREMKALSDRSEQLERQVTELKEQLQKVQTAPRR